MDCSKIGNLIFSLRKEKNMKQKDVANLMNISDKTVSKWERGVGCPDISLLPELSQIFGVDIEKILLGDLKPNDSVGGNMKKIKFYVCPGCGNLITSTGETSISCCGRKLDKLEATKSDSMHYLKLEDVEDEIFISTDHGMEKEHFISFVAFATGDKLLIAKQYPEWGLQFRFRKFGHGKLYFYCTKHGLFYQII